MLLIIITIFVTLFAKEFIVINEEFIVICGFLTIFSLIKAMLTPVMVEAFASYSENIKNTYVKTLKEQLNENKGFSNVNLTNVDIKENLIVFYSFLVGYSIMFLNSITISNMITTIESIKISLTMIINQIKRMIRGKH